MNERRNACLIVEGGGFKTAFTSGVLDAFLSQNFNNFNGYLGVSGGAIAVSYFLSEQFRFCFNAIELLAVDQHFMKFKRTFGNEGMMDIDYLEKVAKEKVPFDIDKALENIQDKMVAFVATNRKYGNPEYLNPDKKNWINSVIASSTLPFVTKGKHKFGGKAYFDGGWSDPLPVIWATEEGFNDITVIRTSPQEIKTSQSWTDYFGSIYFSKRPELSKVFTTCYDNYNQAVDFMKKPPKGIIINQIAPDQVLKSGTYSYSDKTIIDDYRYGLDLGINYIMDRNKK